MKLKNLTFVLLCTAALSTQAFALGDVSQSTKNDNNSTATVGNVAGGNATGGSATIARGAIDNNNANINGNLNSNKNNSSVKNSGNSSNRNTNKQDQGQLQGQAQGQSTTISDNSVYEAQKRAPVSTAYSAPLTAAEDACMGSTSAGAQGIGFGLSVGSTWQDDNCVRRKDSRELYNMGHRKAATALMCQNSNIREALEAAGESCPVARGKAKAVRYESSNNDYEAKEEAVTVPSYGRNVADRNFLYFQNQK